MTQIMECLHLRQISDLQLSNTDTIKSNNPVDITSQSSFETIQEKYQKCLEEICEKDREITKLRQTNAIINENIDKMKKFMRICKEENEVYNLMKDELHVENQTLKE